MKANAGERGPLPRVEDGGDQPHVVDTPGGRIHVQWETTKCQRHTKRTAGLLCRILSHHRRVRLLGVTVCPLVYTSPNAPTKRDVLGTWLLGILAGHNRYAHITALRGDAVSPQILGMQKIISEDALRRALSRMSADQAKPGLHPNS